MNATGAMEISVVIPARNVASTLPLQLDALERQDYDGAWEIIVVDNGSTDDTAKLVAERGGGTRPQVRLLASTEPGANRARNLGVAAACAPDVLLCDADDEVAPGWLRAMQRALLQHDIVGGSLEYTRLNSPLLQRTRPHLGVDDLVPAVHEVKYAVTSNMGIRRAVFQELGGFDESFGTGADDIDFSLSAQRAGFDVGFARDAVVHYRLREDLRGFARQSYAYALGHAHLHAKHSALGTFPDQSVALRARLLLRQVRALGRGISVQDPASRWILAGRSGWLAGSVRGLLEYRAIVTY